MKKILLILMIGVIFLTGCNQNENVNNQQEEISSGENDSQKENSSGENNVQNEVNSGEDNSQDDIENGKGKVYPLSMTEEKIDDVIYKTFENDLVVIKLKQLEETHDYSMFEGESINTYATYFDSVYECGKVNITEEKENGKINLDIYSDSDIYLCVLKDNVLSIVFETPTYPGITYVTLNIDINSKKILDRDEFIKLTQKDTEQLQKEVKQIEYDLITEFCEELGWKEIELYKSKSYFEEKYDYSKSSFCYNELGHLCLCFETYFGIPGAGPVKYLYDLESKSVVGKIFGY